MMNIEEAQENLRIVNDTIKKSKYNLFYLGVVLLVYGLLGEACYLFNLLFALHCTSETLAVWSTSGVVLRQVMDWTIRILWFMLFYQSVKREDKGTQKLFLMWGLVLIVAPLLYVSFSLIFFGTDISYLRDILIFLASGICFFYMGKALERKIYYILAFLSGLLTILCIVLWCMGDSPISLGMQGMYVFCIVLGGICMKMKWNLKNRKDQ
ncbi:MAG: hypothetical protein J5993_05395 [Clostridia bacterium]|nr:hypothetical protein [Clostridia bacterium]